MIHDEIRFTRVKSLCDFDYSMFLAQNNDPYLEDELFQNLGVSIYLNLILILFPKLNEFYNFDSFLFIR